jgi:ATP-dependent DNA ligase
LPFDPMPDRIEPCLALLQAKVPAGPDWLFEVKWDGYRLAVHIDRQHASSRAVAMTGRTGFRQLPPLP